MKRWAFLIACIALLVVAAPVAAKPDKTTCAVIQDGTLLTPDDESITTGYSQWGYNYQAHMFNGMWCDYHPYYREGGGGYEWCQQTMSNVELMMKWNDAWLSNKDCDEDLLLDRHYGFDTYVGSGAWLTNHAKGTYTGSEWMLNGDYVLSFDYLGSLYVHDMTVTTATDGTFSGTGAYPSGGPYSITWIVSGTISSNNISFQIAYDGSGYYVDAVGTINSDGTLGGTWGNAGQSGTWTATSGMATKECIIEDFVKIVAVPTGATQVEDTEKCPAFLGDGSLLWKIGDEEIGCSIWGSFAIIQEKSSDPCGEYGAINYLSPLRKGLGNWADN